jgi:hypothetical protein
MGGLNGIRPVAILLMLRSQTARPMTKVLITCVCLLLRFCAWLHFYSPPLRVAKPSFDAQYLLQQIEDAVKTSHGFAVTGFKESEISLLAARSRAEVLLKSYYHKLFPPPATSFSNDAI